MTKKLQTSYCFILCCLVLPGCASAPKEKPISLVEKIQTDQNYSTVLVQKFESQLIKKQDVEISVYLKTLTETLAQATPLKNAPIGVITVSDPENKWRTYALPEARIYLPIELLKNLNSESELAATLAFELAKLNQNLVFKQIENQFPLSDPSEIEDQLHSLEFFTPRGIFAFKEEDLFLSVVQAVDILYRSRFDPRGLLALWNKFIKNPKYSPLDSSTLQKLLEKTYTLLAIYTPLRNPIIRSNRFIDIQSRIKNL